MLTKQNNNKPRKQTKWIRSLPCLGITEKMASCCSVTHPSTNRARRRRQSNYS